MRNKFSELIDTGVAEFKYVNTVTDTTDPICREYNNLYSISTNTHMNPYKGGYIITGDIFVPKYGAYSTGFNLTMSTCSAGLMNGYTSIFQFFSAHNLIGDFQIINGDNTYVLKNTADFDRSHIWTSEEIEQAVEGETGNLGCPGCYYECGSNIPHPISELISNVTEDPVKFYECFNTNNKEDVVKMLNESQYINGKYFQYQNNIYGYVNGKNIKL